MQGTSHRLEQPRSQFLVHNYDQATDPLGGFMMRKHECFSAALSGPPLFSAQFIKHLPASAGCANLRRAVGRARLRPQTLEWGGIKVLATEHQMTTLRCLRSRRESPSSA